MSPQLYMSMHGLNNLINNNVQLQRLDDINDNDNVNDNNQQQQQQHYNPINMKVRKTTRRGG